ncbi:MAG TPA: hypothetical protein ENN61_03970 [Bacteroidaceae bacterium]|nr:hypothetical protein [Bacteroidaceae bacterium]
MKAKTLTIEKTIKIIGLSFVLFAISASTFGQIKNFRENMINIIKDRFLNKAETHDLFIPAVYYVEAELAIAPSISRTIYTNSLEVVYEAELAVEDWMMASFETAFEESVAVESWMTAPFEVAFEESVAVESWMTAPFDIINEEDLIVENWMAHPRTWLN